MWVSADVPFKAISFTTPAALASAAPLGAALAIPPSDLAGKLFRRGC